MIETDRREIENAKKKRKEKAISKKCRKNGRRDKGRTKDIKQIHEER